MRQGLMLVAVGLTVGLGLAFLVTKLMRGLLFDTPPTDVGTFAVAGLALFLTAAVACFLPARRALAIDPVRALRSSS